MAKKRRQGRIPTPAWEEPRGGAIGRRVLGRSFQFYGLVVIVVLVVVSLAVVGYAFWEDEAERRGRPGSTAVEVGDTSYRLDYFSDRLQMYIDQVGGLSSSAAEYTTAIPVVAETLIREEIVRQFAEGLEATDDEVKAEIATRLGITVDDESFDTVFEQELARSGLSEEEYQDMIRASVLETKLLQRFTDQVPETAESVRYRQILVSTQDEANEVIAEIEGGADFADVAAERSLDTETKDDGGEVGWIPRGLGISQEDVLFDAEVGELTSIPAANGVLVIEVEKKADSRKIEEGQRQPLASRAFQDWLDGRSEEVEIVNNMDLADGDGDKISWVFDQVYQS